MSNFIPENIVTDIQTAANIVDVVSEVVMIKKAGKDFIGLCPFHSEKTPSFTVSPAKQIFYCFGCGEGGNVFNFLMKYEGLTFPDAVRTLGRRYGIEIPENPLSPEETRNIREQEELIWINQEAMTFFQRELTENWHGQKALEYLKKRGMNRKTAARFNIGYARPGWDNLLKFFSEKNIPPELLEKAGLVISRKNGTGFYDRFRDRIIFPIIDVRSRVTGFGGRVMDDSLPKYLNSPETPVFNKSRTLYGIQTAQKKTRESGIVYMTEGYFDVTALYRHGIENAVATLGTALTGDHVRLLKRYTRQAVLVYDSDQAGIRAAMRSVDIFHQENMELRILILPDGHDPDSFLIKFGPEAFMEKAKNASGAISFLINEAVKKHGLSVEGRLRIIEDIQPSLALIRDKLARSLYIRELAGRIEADEAMILERMGKIPDEIKAEHPQISKSAYNSREYAGPPDIPLRAQGERIYGRNLRMEKKLIAMMLQFPEMLPEIEQRCILKHFEDTTLKSLGQIILSKHKDRSGEQVSNIIDIIEDKEMRDIAASLAMDCELWTREGCLGLLAQFKFGRKRRNYNMLQKIEAASREKDHELLYKLMEEKQEL